MEDFQMRPDWSAGSERGLVAAPLRVAEQSAQTLDFETRTMVVHLAGL